MNGQLQLFSTEEPKPVGADCEFFGGEFVGFARCLKHPTPIYTCCNKSVCGEPPRCAYDKPDNSEAAKRRRLEWMKNND